VLRAYVREPFQQALLDRVLVSLVATPVEFPVLACVPYPKDRHFVTITLDHPLRE
jgi:hypothetical protein